MSTIATEIIRCPIHGIPDCSPLLNGCSVPNRIAAEVERIVAVRLAAERMMAWGVGHDAACPQGPVCSAHQPPYRAVVAADPADTGR